MKIQEYIEYIKQPLQFIGNHKIMALATSWSDDVFFAITQWIGNSMLFLSTVLVINISFYIFVFYTFILRFICWNICEFLLVNRV